MIFKTVLGTIKNIKSLLIASDKQLNLNEMNISGKSQCLLKIGAVKNSGKYLHYWSSNKFMVVNRKITTEVGTTLNVLM